MAGRKNYPTTAPSRLNAKRKRRPKKRLEEVKCRLGKEQREFLDYKDIPTLLRFISDQGKIYGRRRSGCSAQQQRILACAIKHARHMALLPFVDV